MSLAVTAVASEVVKRATSHRSRHGVATPMSGAGDDIRAVREHVGRGDAGTLMICTNVPNEDGLGVRSPLNG